MYNHQEPSAPPGTVISTNQTVNLTATLAALSCFAGIFLCFADQRSHTVRRYSVQSVGLGAAWIAMVMVLWILAAILGWIPLIGTGLTFLCLILGTAGSILCLMLRVRMMFSAYRGLAYQLPGIGVFLRRFE